MMIYCLHKSQYCVIWSGFDTTHKKARFGYWWHFFNNHWKHNTNVCSSDSEIDTQFYCEACIMHNTNLWSFVTIYIFCLFKMIFTYCSWTSMSWEQEIKFQRRRRGYGLLQLLRYQVSVAGHWVDWFVTFSSLSRQKQLTWTCPSCSAKYCSFKCMNVSSRRRNEH